MARISELEQRNADTLEIAISQAEYDDLIAPTDPLELRITILNSSGDEIGNFLLPTDQAQWTLDPQSGEYIYTEVITGFGNHRTNWDGLVLSSVNGAGLDDTVQAGLMIGPFGLAVDADGTLATTVGTSANIPSGTALTLIDQSVVVGAGAGATVRFDAPDINTPIVSTDDGIGDSGTAPPVCFAAKTLITCAGGDKPIETLKAGDLVLTHYHGPQQIRWIGKITVTRHDMEQNARKRPVRIAAFSLGQGMPAADLIVTRQHRIVAASAHVAAITGHESVFIAAHRLTELPRVSLVLPKKDMTYYHILFDRHEVILANGMPSESLYMGDQARQFISRRALIEIEEAGIMQDATDTALPVPDHQTQKQIAAKHAASGAALYTEQPQHPSWVVA
jgi:hypothetical protein